MMTYNWDNMVEITVPKGTNGWVYSGEVTINGVKVRFPVGTPTTVPEPAAALLNKMIEIEREDDLSGAKPNNHYVGNVTVPDGKTLTLQKGAKVVDEAGVLGGSSAPAEVVILPETTVELAEGQGILTAPLTTMPADGETLVVTYNGTDYDCPALVGDMGGEMCLVGTFAMLGVPGGNPNAPFMIMISSDPDAVASAGYAGMIMALDGATSVTLSIAKKTGGMSAAELPFVIVPFTVENSEVNILKSFDSIMALSNSGKMVYLCGTFVNAMWYLPMVVAGSVDGKEKIVFGSDSMQFEYTRDGVKVS